MLRFFLREFDTTRLRIIFLASHSRYESTFRVQYKVLRVSTKIRTILIFASENERALTEVRSQLQLNLNRERSRMIEENRATIETLREEHTNRVTDLRHDYRAEVGLAPI